MDTKKRIIFVVNPISGTHGKEFILKLIGQELDASKYDYSIRKTEYAGHASEIAAQAAAEGTDIVVATAYPHGTQSCYQRAERRTCQDH